MRVIIYDTLEHEGSSFVSCMSEGMLIPASPEFPLYRTDVSSFPLPLAKESLDNE